MAIGARVLIVLSVLVLIAFSVWWTKDGNCLWALFVVPFVVNNVGGLSAKGVNSKPKED
jgi:hypothetical protein